LNDFRNFQTAVKVIKKNSKHFQGTICYSLTEPRLGGEVYNLEYYLEKAKLLEDMGADTICIKDMAGLIAPYDAYNLISLLKQEIKAPLHLHTHFTSGMGDLSLLKAIEAGVDIIDTCMAPYAYRSSHPAVEPLVVTLLGTNRDTGFDVEHLAKINEQLEKNIPKYMQFLNETKLSIIDTNVLLHQTPGGMLSNLVNQLKQMGELEKLDDVFKELPRVRKELGQIPLVTPTSQIVGTQTVNNVLFDKDNERYLRIAEQVKDLCFGLYGATPKPIDENIQNKALKDYPRGSKPITLRPGEILEPELEKAKEEVKDITTNIDDVLTYALFPVTGQRFLKWKYGLEEMPADVKAKTLEDVEREKALIEKALAGALVEKQEKSSPPKPENLRTFDVYVDGEYFKIEINTNDHFPAVSHGHTQVQPGLPAASAAKPGAAPSHLASKPQSASKPAKVKPHVKPSAHTVNGDKAITAPMPGMIVNYRKKVGDTVKTGETVVIIEAMKMNINIESDCDGIIKEIPCKPGESVAKSDVLCVIKEG
ncbi:MAG: pyruvate carboxylase subunit B, partial [Spirochaetota bacterium]